MSIRTADARRCSRFHKRIASNSKGATIVEFAVILPFFAFLALGIVDISIAILLKQQLNAAALAAGMYASHSSIPTITTANLQVIVDAAVPNQIAKITPSVTVPAVSCVPPVPPNFTLTTTCTATTYAPSYTPDAGSYALITVSATWPITFSMAWSGLSNITLRSYSVIRIK